MTTDRHRACDGARSSVGPDAPLYVYFIDGYSGPVITTEVRPGLMFDTALDNRLVGIEILDYERLTLDGQTVAASSSTEPHWPADGSGDELDGGYDPTAYGGPP